MTIALMSRPLRILYFAGPGDVSRTYRHWAAGCDDPGEVAITYSSQFYDVVRELDAEAMIISSHKRTEHINDKQFRIVQGPIPTSKGRIRFHLMAAWFMIKLMWTAIWFRADVLLLGNGSHFFLLAPLRLLGVKIVPSMHCALWPVGYKPPGRFQRVVQWLNGWFWRRVAHGTIAVSPECERQVREVAGEPRGPIRQVRAQYHRGYFESLAAPPPHATRPFSILYAGRVERSKGVLDLVEIAARLEKERPGQFRWELCGDGEEQLVKDKAAEAGISDLFAVRGRLNQAGMAEAFSRAHVVIVPTKASTAFAEGLNKVTVEAILAGRPVITSCLSNAVEVLLDAVVEVPPDDVRAYGDAIIDLADNAELYGRKVRACGVVSEQFYDRSNGYAQALRDLLGPLNHRCVPAAPRSEACMPAQTAETARDHAA